MRAALRWLGLDWDSESLQSQQCARHEAALAALADRGLLYPCRCSRSQLRRAGVRAADGSWRYPGSCRGRPPEPGELLHSDAALRLRLAPGRVELRDESGLDLSLDPAVELGDPVLRRRDGAMAYHLAVVVDDAAEGVGRVVRGRDLAPATALHRTLQRLLGLPTPRYRHHLLLLEETGGKLAKLHGAVAWHQLRERYSGAELCGLLAQWLGLRERAEPLHPPELLAGFDWRRVRERDLVLRWTGAALEALA